MASSSSVAAQSSSVPSGAAAKPPLAFDFTKRKRWADLLVGELSDAISLLLLPTGQILYCGPAVRDLLGWKDTELIDYDLFDLVAGKYRVSFRRFKYGAAYSLDLGRRR
jgi:PAS domain-containing protein